jgi:hypothetical protein
MRRIISIVPLLFVLNTGLPDAAAEEPAEAAPAAATERPVLQDNVPDRYVVVKGDTLWDISARFLKNPWKWPELWGINKEQIHNPHLIYPGDVVLLDRSAGGVRLRLEGAEDGGSARWTGNELQLARLSPQVRGSPVNAMPIPTIPAKSIEPFLVRPLVVDSAQVARAPTIVATTDKRVVISAGDTAWVKGMPAEPLARWQVYRQGRVFQDPDSKELLGFEAVYLGDADVSDVGPVSTVQIARASQEIAAGDKLAAAPPVFTVPYVPHAPEQKVRGRIIAGSDNAVEEMGTYSVIIMNRGARNGLEVGHVLGLYRSEGSIPMGNNKVQALPEQQYGLVLVFRVFDKMSYGVVMSSRRPVHVMDTVANP